MYFLPIVVVLIVLAVLSRRLGQQRREIEALTRRITALEMAKAANETTATPAHDPAMPAAPPVHEPPAHALAPASPAHEPAVQAHAPAWPAHAAPLESPPAPPPQRAAHRVDAEQWVGAVGLQNVGSVLLLVGFFFLVVWGYTTGKLGPLALVAAGVAAGVGVIWRGDRMQRTVPGIGHALIGVGAGIVWLALYLGYTTLRALPAEAALPLLFAASMLTGGLGFRYRVEGIAALGLLGAFMPHLLRFVAYLPATPLPPWGLYGYLVSINVLVFALAWRSGWSRLALASVLLTAVAWSSAVSTDHWSWTLQLGLSALFLALGTAPLPRLARAEGRVRPVDLALIAAAPVAMLAASWPMFALARSEQVAVLLGALAVVYLGLAWAVDRVRPERDLWRPLTAASTLCLVVATERAVGPENTGLAWTVEGVVLALLGLAPRSGWLRGCGYVVVAAAMSSLFYGYFAGFEQLPKVPFVHPLAIREAVAIVALLFGAGRVRGAPLADGERAAANAWLGFAHGLLALWLGRESYLLSSALEGGSGIWRSLPDVRSPGSELRKWALTIETAGLALMAQAAWLVWRGTRNRVLFSRVLGYAIGVVAAALLAEALRANDGWGRDRLAILHRDGLVVLGAIAIAMAVASVLRSRRDELRPAERRASEVVAAAASFLMLLWTGREADHVARVMLDLPAAGVAAWNRVEADVRDRVLSLAAILATVGWLVQAVIAFVLGWRRRSAFLRWMALALLGLTLLKFVLVDLAHADPFWRFLTALLAGAAMLALSFVYQRLGAGRSSGAERAPAPRPAAEE
jgi:predicted membrane protein DUF2339